MRLYVKVNGRPGIIIGYGPGKSSPMAIVIGLDDFPTPVALDLCELPKLPKRLRKKIKNHAKKETQDVMVAAGQLQ